MLRLVILLFAFGIITASTPPRTGEVCDNGIDDDGDGLVDLNDPECICPPREPVSLIPNPSFEERTCCPEERSQLFCAEDWIQASEATTDLISDCGWGGWDYLPPPRPFPDGESILGFRNGVPMFDDFSPGLPNWKEYAGACLRGPLRAGETYGFVFDVGFTPRNSPATSLYFFGTPDCEQLPFGVGDAETGCPTNTPGWLRLGQIFISGEDEWRNYQLSITPSVDIAAIAIGPDCTPNTGQIEAYYYFDNLILAEQNAFLFQIQPGGNPCAANYRLTAPVFDSLTYQWYLDGVALVGETSPTLEADRRYGDYQVRLIGPNSCYLLDTFTYEQTFVYEDIERTICAEDVYDFGGAELNTSGRYLDTLISSSGCDSVVTLALQVSPPVRDTQLVRILPDEVYRVDNRTYREEDVYDISLVSEAGCDSLLNLTLEHYRIYVPSAFSPNFDGINDDFRIFTGPGVLRVEAFRIFDRWGGIVYATDAAELAEATVNEIAWDASTPNGPAPAATYIYQLQLAFDDGNSRMLSGSIVLLR